MRYNAKLAAGTLLALGGVIALCCTGCASFRTKQTDISYDEQGRPQRAITTIAKATTLASSKSALTNFKASQTDKTQGASVGSLAQESTTTNIAANLSALTELLRVIRSP